MTNSNLDDARYFSLATFRKSGAVVATPVWFAEGNEPGAYYVFSAGEAGKVKRLRAGDQARVARCDARGKLLGDWCPARAELLVAPADIAAALAALHRKYGWLMRMTDILARLSGRFDKRAYIKVQVIDA